ncbi:MAG: MFS transporter [Proteobacteria bacterium]|nr:MFS transporter [Pseudomonadota bacterium]
MAKNKKIGAVATMKSIKPAFWTANVLEAGERLAYFGIRAVLPLMMVSDGVGGLGLSPAQKGAIFGLWALLQCLIPMVSGGFAESFGYKKSLFTAFTINILGYLMMANILPIAHLITGTTELNVGINFILMMIAGCTIGVGTAIFKPPVQGVVAQSLNEHNSGFGFGLFYWVVNVGGFLAPMVATALRGSDSDPTWSHVFYGAAIVTAINLLVTIFLFKEPAKKDAPKTNDEKIEETQKKEGPVRVLIKTLKTLWDDKRMLCFLLIVSGFWLMFMQLWDLLPNFLDEWVDRRDAGSVIAALGITSWLESDGALKPEMIINIDSAAIILFVLPLSAFFARYKMMTSLVLGMIISVVGFIMSGMTMSGGMACLAIFIFAIGEIICSPKFNEYIGMTAPEDKKAIYMGYSNIPFAVGWAAGNFLSGPLYQLFSSKEVLAKQYLLDNNVLTSAAMENMKLADLMNAVQTHAGVADVYAANEVLWNLYNPWIIWIILGAVGVVSMIALICFYYKSGMYLRDEAGKKEDDNDTDETSSETTETADKSDFNAVTTENTDTEDKVAENTISDAKENAEAEDKVEENSELNVDSKENSESNDESEDKPVS